MKNTYCNSAAEILRMAEGDPVYARALQKAKETDAFWRASFADDPAWRSGWGHNFVCPYCAAHYLQDYVRQPGRAYRCPNCGKTSSGRLLDEAWVYGYRAGAASGLVSSALNYHVTGERDSLDHIIRCVDFYADAYEHFPVHGDWAGKGRVMGQSLDEAVWALRILRALNVCGRDSFPEEKRIAWRDRLFLPLAELVGGQADRIHNIPLWLQAACGVIGLFFEDEALLEKALEGEFGIRNQARKGYTADGLWYECSMGYHYYASEALTEFLSAYVLRDPDDALFEIMRRAYRVPWLLSSDGWSIPALNDGWYPISIANGTRALINAFRTVPDAELAAQLRLIRTREPERFENAEALLFMREGSEEGKKPVRSDTILFPDTCLAVMNRPVHALLKSGVLSVSHMHPDCMSLCMQPFAEDIGTPGYGHPMTPAYYRTTLCHNTFLADGTSQPMRPVRGRMEKVQGGVRAHAEEVYDGVACTRTLTEANGMLHDVMEIESEDTHQFDWVLHSAGEAQLPAGGSAAALPGAEKCYDYLSDVVCYEGAETFEARFRLNGKTLLVRIGPETLRQARVYTARMPGNPADHPLTAILLRARGSHVRFAADYSVS